MPSDYDEGALLNEALATLRQGFADLPAFQARVDHARVGEVLRRVAERLRDNCPYHHPLYVGQMLKPPHPVARLAYALALELNPNNHALDGGRASSAMEREAVARIARMFGWTEHLGHLTGGGTLANLEALWVGRELRPGSAVAASSQAHYTHARVSKVLEIPFHEIGVDATGRMDVGALEMALRSGEIGTVVATLGTTAAGTVDPLPEMLALRKQYDFRLHVDSAYGGYFKLARNLDPPARAAFDRIGEADSIVVDPHKHGLQPFGCGCVVFRDPSVGRFYHHSSPYTYFSSPELHLGEISLECSRPGAAAVALWATLELLPLESGGEFGQSLEACREAALALHAALEHDDRFVPVLRPSLDIVVWAMKARSATESSAAARQLFDAAARHDLHLSLAKFPRQMLAASAPVSDWDLDEIICLRACVMKPEHREWMPQIIERLQAAVDQPRATR
jgi:glutamate/tyrosine decarboxylase-like PLP-dependent enzyme